MGRKPEGQAEKLFKNLGKKIDQLIVDIKKGAEDPAIKDRYEELKRSGEKLKSEFDHFKNDHKDVFNDIESSFEKAGKEIRKTFNSTFKTDDKNKKET